MSADSLSHRISGFARIYRELYGDSAHDEALRYALVARSISNSEEHGFWLEVAKLLETGLAPEGLPEAA